MQRCYNIISAKTLVFHSLPSMLNMIWFPDCDPTRFCNSEPDRDRTGFRKKLYRISYGYPNCVGDCSQMFNHIFFGYQPDWIKYL